MRQVHDMSDKDLDTELGNYERFRVSNEAKKRAMFEKSMARYRDLLDERSKRGGFNLEVTLEAIGDAAKYGAYLSYGDVANANGLDWSMSVRRAMPKHLWDVVSWSHERGMPMLSAIIVNKPNLLSGEMEPDALEGFTSAAEGLGHTVTDPEGFLREQQDADFQYFSDQK